MTMANKYLPKLTIAILALSIALILVTTQPNIVSAAPTTPTFAPTSAIYSSYTPTYNGTHHYWNNGYCWGGYYYWYDDCYYSSYYYYGYPYYYSYYNYPYYYGDYYGNYYGNYGNYYGSYGYSPSTYTLTVNTNPSNLGSVTGGGSYNSGSSASFSVTQTTIQVSSNTRYVFDHWSGDYSGSGTSGSVTVNGAMTVTAIYKTQYYLTVNAQPSTHQLRKVPAGTIQDRPQPPRTEAKRLETPEAD